MSEVNTVIVTAYKYTKQSGSSFIVLDKSLIEERGMKDSDFAEVTLILSEKDVESLVDCFKNA